jgi:hypothetical protein
MKPTQTQSKIGTAALTLSLLAGIVGASSLTAQAQYGQDRAYQFQRDRDRDRDQDRDRDRDYERNRRGRRWDRYGTYGGSFQLRQTALNAGYNEGIKEGRKDRRRGRRSSFRDFSAYRNADHDYSSRLGDKELYRRYYREGFENGYEDGVRGY